MFFAGLTIGVFLGLVSILFPFLWVAFSEVNKKADQEASRLLRRFLPF
ncbi:hypothetical protein KOR42_32810 [Thalassoglobus neptunius]|uniref:Uncharacterized protein n=1 Tax=Thalassoglobus neptunius TaxID=1938619 RepID=A0A5C5WMG4_9PLAN|nr:hypothetical protein KOR42_32810 [Thalassoglobus neptunius]